MTGKQLHGAITELNGTILIALPLLDKSTQRRQLTQRLPGLLALDDQVSQRHSAAQRKVIALARNRVQRVSRIAQHYQPCAHLLLRQSKLQRIVITLAHGNKTTGTVAEALLQACQKRRVIQRQHTVQFVITQRPDQTTTAVAVDRFAGQQRQRAILSETLIGYVTVRPIQ